MTGPRPPPARGTGEDSWSVWHAGGVLVPQCPEPACDGTGCPGQALRAQSWCHQSQGELCGSRVWAVMPGQGLYPLHSWNWTQIICIQALGSSAAGSRPCLAHRAPNLSATEVGRRRRSALLSGWVGKGWVCTHRLACGPPGHVHTPVRALAGQQAKRWGLGEAGAALL